MSMLEPTILAHWKGQLDAEPSRIVQLLGQLPRYRAHFSRCFRCGPEPERVAEALAAFVRTIRSGHAPYDRYEVGGDPRTVPENVRAGAKIFAQKAQCALCHPPPLYTDLAFHGPGVAGAAKPPPAGAPEDHGRARVTKSDRDKGAFKTPTLRGVTLSPPYFHDGSAATLEDAARRCLARGGRGSDTTADGLPEPAHLTKAELDQLLAFVQALTPEQKPYKRPKLPRQPPPAP
jgi:cytochrome c peroxidase